MVSLSRTLLVFSALLLVLGAGPLAAQHLLVPMDRTQSDHLRAYGLAYWLLEREEEAEWLLNYRDGSFLLPDLQEVRREAAVRGVRYEEKDAADVARIRSTIESSNMEAILLETAPRIAIYTPPHTSPWDDAVTLALSYAGIPYETIWDPEVLTGELSEFDWLHLHHEDFTGQYSKFFTSYAGATWFREEVRRNEEVADAFGFPNVPELKKAVAWEIREYVEAGGFLFAMCSATETIDLALAAGDANIAASFSSGMSPEPEVSSRMDWSRAFAFQGGQVQTASTVNAFSDIDSHQVNTQWRESLGYFTLFEFSAKIDPVPSMLVQNHEDVIPDFYGLTTAFQSDRLKPGVTVLAQEGPWAKYIHGTLGEGTWTFYGGHDPEDPEHQIGDAPTDLSLHPNSPGYRLILNNVLFPAARPEPQKT